MIPAEIKKSYAQRMRWYPTKSEEFVWERLRHGSCVMRCLRQVVKRGYILDLFFPSAQLAVEIDGSSHNDRKGYDARRDAHLLRSNIETLRLNSDDCRGCWPEIRQQIEAVVKARHATLAHTDGSCKFPRMCKATPSKQAAVTKPEKKSTVTMFLPVSEWGRSKITRQQVNKFRGGL